MATKNFTATNGYTLQNNGGLLRIKDDLGENTLRSYDFLNNEDTRALREFFRHERDEELGRWRSSIHPSWTAVEDGRVYRFTNDDGKRGFDVHKEDRSYTGWLGELREVAKEYLAAHHISKPWHDAKPDEIWALRQADADAEYVYRWDAAEQWWFASNSNMAMHRLDEKAIVSGRRIWPEA